MKYNYSCIKDENGNILFKFSSELRLLEYVFEDMLSFGEPIFREFIKKVICGNSQFEEIEGNMCSLEIRNDHTIIRSEFVTEDMLEKIEIDTNELLSLIDIWIEKNNF